MGTFDPTTFLDATMTDANSTALVPCPEGEYQAIVIDEPKIRQFSGTKDPSKQYVALDLEWVIEDPRVTDITQRKPTKVRQSIMLDFTESGALDMGKGRNVALGRLREAVNMNQPGQAFSFRKLQGAMAKVKVTHSVADDTIYDEIRSVARLA